MSDTAYLSQRGVVDLVHFTACENLEGILTKGIIPRTLLEVDSVEFIANDQVRLDGKEHVNLSITNPNISMFFRFKKQRPGIYVVLTLDIALLDEYKHSFTSTNAASHRAIKRSVEELFDGERSEVFKDNWTSDNQAEVLIHEIIDPKYIKTVQFRFEDREDFAKSKQLVEQLGLETALVLCDQLHSWNADAVRKGFNEPYSPYFESWKAEYEQYQQIAEIIRELKWSTKFDSIAVHRDKMDRYNQDSANMNRSNIARWSLDYYRPSDVVERSDNELSALAVIEKVINRGRITVVSEKLESAINSGFINFAHQVQAIIIELIKHQALRTNMTIYVDNSLSETATGGSYVVEKALEDLEELSDNVCSLYACENLFTGITTTDQINKADLVLSRNTPSTEEKNKTAVVTDLNDESVVIEFDFTKVQNPVELNIQDETIEFLLNYIYGFDKFRENQINGIVRGLKRVDSIVLLPTGSGKSVVFQLLSLITPGVGIVVAPIISLIEDQIINLYNRGIDRVVGISSAMSRGGRDDAVEGIKKGQYIMSFVAPERFQNIKFVNAIEIYAATNIISAIAVDEAHCVSEWGHDFRTSYLGLARTSRRICKTGDSVPPLLALTGTASASVLRDMQHDLEISDDAAVIQPSSFDRPEIVYRVYGASSDNKKTVLEDIIKNKLPASFGVSFDEFYEPAKGPQTNCGMVFCQNASGSYGILATERQVQYGHLGAGDTLNKILPGKVGMYSGKPPKRLGVSADYWNSQKRLNATQFKNNDLPIIVCTKAFGMGIDKPNVRWIIHYGIPSSLESFYQEAGRAARDKQTSYAYIILSDDYPELNRRILNPANTSIYDIEALDKTKGQWKEDDISRVLFFHKNSFQGLASELQLVRDVLDRCTQATWRNQRFHIPFMNDKSETEKAVYRLQLLGFFKGYSVDYNSNCFVIEADKLNRETIIENYIEYIRAYQDNDDYADTAREILLNSVEGLDGREFMVKVVETLLKEFTYKVVEEGRRRAIFNMLDAAKLAADCPSDTEADVTFRKKLLAYLSTDMTTSGKRARLEDIINKATDIDLINKIIQSNKTKAKKERVLGETARLLEAYPQHYGYHYIQAAMSINDSDCSKMVDSINAAVRFGTQNYGLGLERIRKDIFALLNSRKAQKITAETWNSLAAEIGQTLSLSEEEVYGALNTEQALMSRRVKGLYNIANTVRSRREYHWINLN